MDHTPQRRPAVTRNNLNDQVYDSLHRALLEGRLRPHQRLKIRDLALALEVSETPVREAVMQLVRERALVLQSSRSFKVPRLSAEQYLELRSIRLELEGLAAATAAPNVTARDIVELRKVHEQVVKAEAAGNAAEAVRLNWLFRLMVYRRANMPELINIIEGLWMRTGPLLTYLHPHARPTYPGRHRHLDVIDELARGDSAAVRAAIIADTVEGGASLLKFLNDLDDGTLDEAELSEPFEVPLSEILIDPKSTPAAS